MLVLILVSILTTLPSASAEEALSLAGALQPYVKSLDRPDHWLLYRLELPVGASYLDLTTLESKADGIPAPLVAELKSKGCSETQWHYFLYKSFDRSCREIALKTLRDLGVTLIDFSWGSSDFSPFHSFAARSHSCRFGSNLLC